MFQIEVKDFNDHKEVSRVDMLEISDDVYFVSIRTNIKRPCYSIGSSYDPNHPLGPRSVNVDVMNEDLDKFLASVAIFSNTEDMSKFHWAFFEARYGVDLFLCRFPEKMKSVATWERKKDV